MAVDGCLAVDVKKFLGVNHLIFAKLLHLAENLLEMLVSGFVLANIV